jgi:Bacterial archaeo-eukaryotic release factor family 10
MLDTTLLNSLGSYWSEEGNAVSFYFSEARPQNRAHSAGMITAKELARNIGRTNPSPELRKIIDRLIQRGEELRSSQHAGLAIFAAPHDYWREIDLPFFVQPQSSAGSFFVLSPLLPALAERPKYFILLVDRAVTRLLLVDGEEAVEQAKEVDEERQKIRESGTSRKVSDERSKEDDAYQHLRHAGEHLLGLLDRRMAEGVYVGCRKELWSEIKAAMPDGVIRAIAGQFSCDPGLISVKEVIDLVAPEIKKRDQERLQGMIGEMLGGAARNAKGAVGPLQVIQALEQGEIQTIVVTPHTPVSACICTACDHIDTGRPATCSLCGNPVHRFNDLAEILVRRAGRGAFSLQIAPPEEAIAQAQGFLAKLRFRADRSTAQVA